MEPCLLPDTPIESKGVALVVDDELSNRVILKSLLKRNGYEVIEAHNGADAVQLCQDAHPDMVFMDILMPVMDGYEAVSRIRQIDFPYFLPIIFLTAVTNDDALSKCIEVGGDDFLTKPFSQAILKSKIHAMERIKALYQKTSSLSGQLMKDQEMAEGVFSGAVLANNVAEDKIHRLLKPAELFSGDVFLSAYAPSQDLNVMLGDFTGHGLAAAIGALPTSEVFRAMTNKGFNPAQILGGINKKLHSLLPTGMFLAVQFVSISHNLDYITVCNCGMPDMLLLDGQTGKIKTHIKSSCLPLGIDQSIDFHEAFKHINIEPGDRLLMVSDGVSEARNPHNEYFGQHRIEAAIRDANDNNSAFSNIVTSLEQFCEDAPQDDDISLAEIPFTEDILPDWNALTEPARMLGEETIDDDKVEFSLTLNGRRLRDADPVPLVINQLQETEGLSRHRRHLFTILTELYVNALDHGVLKLSSDLKNSPEGFTRYFTEREQRLSLVTEGFVSIHIASYASKNHGKLHITVRDSGSGFSIQEDCAQGKNKCCNTQLLSGRGIKLVRELCEKVIYHPPGNMVEAHYYWNNED